MFSTTRTGNRCACSRVLSCLTYGDVARAVQERTTVLIVAGNMFYDRVSKSPAEMRAERIDRMQMLSSAEFERFFWKCSLLRTRFHRRSVTMADVQRVYIDSCCFIDMVKTKVGRKLATDPRTRRLVSQTPP